MNHGEVSEFLTDVQARQPERCQQCGRVIWLGPAGWHTAEGNYVCEKGYLHVAQIGGPE
jgi:hypothetical protein